MSEIRVNSIIAEGGSSAPNLTYGAQVPTGMGITGAGSVNLTGIVTAASFSGAATGLTGSGAGLSGIVTSGATASSQTVAGSLIFSGDAQVGGAFTVVGNMTVDGTQTIINTTTLDVADKTVGLGSTTAATNTTAAGAGIEIYASSATANNNKTLLWQNTSNCFEFSDSIKLKGISETSINSGSTGVQTYINGTSLVLELDMEAGSVFNYTTPAVAAASDAAGVGIVSFKNMPANAQNVRTVTVIFTGGKATGGMGNTSPTAGIGVTCRVIPKSGGSAVAGIMT